MANVRTLKKKTRGLARKYIQRSDSLFRLGVVMTPPERVREAKDLLVKMEAVRRKLNFLDKDSAYIAELDMSIGKLDRNASNFAALHNLSWGSS